MSVITNMVEEIYRRLLDNKIGDCPIEPSDQCAYKDGIAQKLGEGWTAHEIYSYYRNTECFNNILAEHLACDRMVQIMDLVRARLEVKQ